MAERVTHEHELLAGLERLLADASYAGRVAVANYLRAFAPDFVPGLLTEVRVLRQQVDAVLALCDGMENPGPDVIVYDLTPMLSTSTVRAALARPERLDTDDAGDGQRPGTGQGDTGHAVNPSLTEKGR